MKRCSTPLIIRKIQSKTTVRYQLTPVRMAVMSKTTDKSWWECREKGTCALLVQMHTVRLLQKTLRRRLRKWESQLPCDPATPLRVFTHRKWARSTCEDPGQTPAFTAALFTIAKIRKWPNRSTDRWTDKEDRCIYTMENCSAIKRWKSCHLQQHKGTLRALCWVK